MKRSVAVLLRRAPFGRVHLAEGLRAASGVAAGFDEHDVTVLFLEDAVHATLERADWDALDMTPHVEGLFEADADLVVDGNALAVRDLDPEAVDERISVKREDEVRTMLRNADRQMTF